MTGRGQDAGALAAGRPLGRRGRRAVLPGGRHAFPRGDTHPLTNVAEAEMKTVSERPATVVARLRDA